jgi:hypothetical protein
MNKRDFVEENETARLELRELIGRLDERSFKCAVESGWTVSTLLCHLAFWDQRVLFLLREWQNGRPETSRLSVQSIDSINEAVKAISQAVPGPAAAKLALDSAAAVDSLVAEISDKWVDQIASAGFERFLRRSLHRREHLQKIEEALQRQPTGGSLSIPSA